jgi:Tat protein translocase TatB subunit
MGRTIHSAIPRPSLPLFALPHYDGSVSFSETIFLFVLALIVFGPKKLPEIARQAGKLLAELRRASNEFRSQIDAEIAHLEVQKSQGGGLPTQAPAGAVASLSQNPSQPISHQIEAATLATSSPESSTSGTTLDAAPASVSSPSSDAAEPVAPTAPETAPENDLTSAPASQDSHV